MSTVNLQCCRRIACALSPDFASFGTILYRHRILQNGPDIIEELLDRHLVKEDRSLHDDEESEILARRRLTSLPTTHELAPGGAEPLPRHHPGHTVLFMVRFAGALWRDVLREKARSEFEAARYEKDPEVITRLLIGGRDAVHQALENLAEKQRQQIQKHQGHDN